jgi:hypothetical protein
MMTAYRAVLILCMLTAALLILGCTAERLSARLAWVGVALLSLTVGSWMLL